MKTKLMGCLFVGLAFSLTLAISARQGAEPIEQTGIPISLPGDETQVQEDQLRNSSGVKAPINLIGVIAVPGGVGALDILWVDQARGRMYLPDRGNGVVDIFDAVNDAFLDRIPGFVGATGFGGLRGGPNGLVVTPDNILWAGDGNSLLQAVDLNLSPPRITHTITVGTPQDGRADEIAYDPFERIVLIANDVSKPPRVTFVSADTYSVLSKIDFPDAEGMEQPVWDTQLHRFLITVPASPAYVAVIDPIKRRVTKKYIIPNCSGGVNGLTLGPFQRLLVSACTNAYIMNAIDGHIISFITQVGGGDEVWFNAGDDHYYVTSADRTAGLGQVLGVIDAETSTWLQNVRAPNIRNVAAFEGNNHIFSGVSAPAAGVPDTTVCSRFGLVGTGCVAVFSHF